ncbi:hypothetical protein RNJ44_04951 [Nakaseomyces bracarensis]|uniref:Derlin n=1 Tax=Nakaseomyces bracarensis TaxID=273131 RepID=A0ABR4NWC5_9SACH
MSLEAPVGLRQFPITKLCMIGSVLIPMGAALLNTKYVFEVIYDPYIKDYGQYWRYITFQLSSVNETDVALIVLLWYQYRHIERLMGSVKYLSALVLLLVYQGIVVTVLHQVYNRMFGDVFQWNQLVSGFYGLVLAIVHFYKQYTPVVYEFDVVLGAPLWSYLLHKKLTSSSEESNKVMKLRFNDQFMVNAFVLILIINQGPWGLVQGFVGWLSGMFLDIGILPGLESWRIPYGRYLIFGSTDRLQQNDESNNTNANDGFVSDNRNQTTTYMDDENDEPGDEPARPLTTQLMDAFRR